MPTYEYECAQCADHFEKFQSIKAAPLKKCPQCGGRVRRLIGTGAGLLFRGSGFYSTDYRSENYKQGAKADTKPAAAQTAPGKPAEKKTAKADKAKTS
ncbi:MAG: zinc ribbon domain-containing protein [Verrucomicrobia bacterium]|nr:MAG: zinc ribbon domain-containing protein [Verrucomicrobiota bacterium]